MLCSFKGFSTCIAIYIGDDGNIYIAADSKRTFFFSDNNGINNFESVCKIHHVGTNYFAVSGIDDGSLLKAANRALQQNTNIDTAIKSFGTAMVKRYRYLMAGTKLYYPDKLKNFLNNGLAQVSFFGFYNGLPRVVDVEFLCHLDKSGKVVPTYRLRPIFALTVIGISTDIKNAQPGDFPEKAAMQQNPSLYVEALVKIEAKKQPQAVGAPIDLMELCPDGAVWIRKNEDAVSY